MFLLLLRFAQGIPQKVLFDIGTGNNRRLIDIHDAINETEAELFRALPAVHAFSGFDTSSFVLKGKLRLWKFSGHALNYSYVIEA